MRKEPIRIALVTNTFGKYHRQNVAVESWIHLKSKFPDVLELYNIQFKDEENTFTDHYEGVKTEFLLENSSKTFEPKSIKKLPVISELIFKAFNSIKADYVLYTNSDVILLPRLIEYIINETPDCMAGPRLDIQSVNSFQEVLDEKVVPVRNEIAGFDVFSFEKKWFEKHKKHFISKFVIGKPLFDVDFAGLMVLFGNKYHIANSYPMMALHIHHGTDAVTMDCPEKTLNEKTHEDNWLFKIANNVMFYNLQHNLCKRKPWGAFIQPQPDEQMIQKQFFDAMNIHAENKIQFIE
jgi:hypothetical protein